MRTPVKRNKPDPYPFARMKQPPGDKGPEVNIPSFWPTVLTSIKLKNYLVCRSICLEAPVPKLQTPHTSCADTRSAMSLMEKRSSSTFPKLRMQLLVESKRLQEVAVFWMHWLLLFLLFYNLQFFWFSTAQAANLSLGTWRYGKGKSAKWARSKSSIFQMNQWNLWEMNQSLPMLDPKPPPTKRIGPCWGFLVWKPLFSAFFRF